MRPTRSGSTASTGSAQPADNFPLNKDGQPVLNELHSDTADAFPVSVQCLDGETLSLTLPPTMTPTTVVALLSLRTPNIPLSDLRLVYAGRPLNVSPNGSASPPPTPGIAGVPPSLATGSVPPTQSKIYAPLNTLVPQNAVLTLSVADNLSKESETSTSESQVRPSIEEKTSIEETSVPSLTQTPSVPILESPTKPANTKPSTTATPKRKKPRCHHSACSAPAAPLVGTCGFCKHVFCGRHRMLEDHACEGLEDAKKESRERNREMLERERTVGAGRAVGI